MTSQWPMRWPAEMTEVWVSIVALEWFSSVGYTSLIARFEMKPLAAPNQRGLSAMRRFPIPIGSERAYR
jgi:hypothetical protein